MISIKDAYSSFSVNNIDETKQFYIETIGIKVEENKMGLQLILPGGQKVFVYEKNDHKPASFTVLNLIVDNIDEAIDQLIDMGVEFKRYENFNQDEKGIARNKSAETGPDIAWFEDPAGNIVSIMEKV